MEKNLRPTLGKKDEERSYRITLLTDLLGGCPKNEEVYRTYIQSKAPVEKDVEDEIKSVEDIEEKGWTGFLMDDGRGIFILDHVIKGHIKAAYEVQLAREEVPKIAAYKKT